MSNTNYTFAVAHIRAMEVSLFTKSVIDQLMACKSYEECMRFLEDKGWGNGESRADADQMLSVERAEIWETVEELGEMCIRDRIRTGRILPPGPVLSTDGLCRMQTGRCSSMPEIFWRFQGPILH